MTMDRLEQLKSFIGKEFTASPSPFMLWLRPIVLSAEKDSMGRVSLRVCDNGPGISPSNLDKIFVPFFTSRKKGSGIGLSLSRHIMKLHHGSIEVKSTPFKETVFSLNFQRGLA